MRFALAFHPLVKSDLADAEYRYQGIEPALGDRLLTELEAEFVALTGNALLFRPRFADIRRANPPIFQYGIFYFISKETVVVLGVLHAARDSETNLLNNRAHKVIPN